MNLVYLVIVMVLSQYIFFGIMVGKARGRYGVKAPATTGNEHFERYFRVHMNTLELLVCFIPAILIAAIFWSAHAMAVIGLFFFVGRFIYYKQYITEPEKRSLGFGMSIGPILIFLIAILIGIIKSNF